MKHSMKIGVRFGFTSAIITTLGLMTGLNSGTHSKLAVLGGVFTIAICDALSDSLGVHISEESELKHTRKEIWTSTFSTFVAKFIIALTFAIPVFIFSLNTAVMINIVYGLTLLTILSAVMAREQKVKAIGVIGEHLFVAILAITISYLVGLMVARFI